MTDRDEPSDEQVMAALNVVGRSHTEIAALLAQRDRSTREAVAKEFGDRLADLLVGAWKDGRDAAARSFCHFCNNPFGVWISEPEDGKHYHEDGDRSEFRQCLAANLRAIEPPR